LGIGLGVLVNFALHRSPPLAPVLRAGAIAIGGGLLSATAIASVWAVIRTAENHARGHAPNMDPGIAVIFAQFDAAPALLALALFESGRAFATAEPLTKWGAFFFGCLVGLPFGFRAFFGSWAGPSHLYLAAAAIAVAAYTVRAVRRRRQP
jgi:hypothetical protein